MYVGRTIDFATRFNYWTSQGATNITPIGENLNYPEMRGLEQLMIEINGGVGNPNVANAINGVAAGNPAYNAFTNAAWHLFNK